jgi:hypothetical protein
MPKAGGPVQILAPERTKVVQLRMAVDEAHAYWISDDESSTGRPGLQAIVRAPKDGSAKATVVAETQGADDLALDASHVYWVEAGPARWQRCGRVMSVPKAGGAPSVVAEQQDLPTQILVHGTSIYWFNSGVYPAPDAGTPLLAVANGALLTTAKQGSWRMLVGNQVTTYGFAVAGDSLYWIEEPTDGIHVIERNSSGVQSPYPPGSCPTPSGS